MTILTAIAKTRLEKVAQDNGYDIYLGKSNEVLSFKSTHCPLTIWLGLQSDTEFIFFVSDYAVLKLLELVTPSTQFNISTPNGSVGGFCSSSLNIIFHLVKRSYQVSRSLPNNPLTEYLETIKEMPATTEVERLTIQRIGQNIFREKLIDYWDGRCAVTGFQTQILLRASHIKPWSLSSDSERMNVFNGLLLSPTLDLAFDQGLITFDSSGVLKLSPSLSTPEANKVGILHDMQLSNYSPEHETFMQWHRQNIFISS